MKILFKKISSLFKNQEHNDFLIFKKNLEKILISLTVVTKDGSEENLTELKDIITDNIKSLSTKTQAELITKIKNAIEKTHPITGTTAAHFLQAFGKNLNHLNFAETIEQLEVLTFGQVDERKWLKILQDTITNIERLNALNSNNKTQQLVFNLNILIKATHRYRDFIIETAYIKDKEIDVDTITSFAIARVLRIRKDELSDEQHKKINDLLTYLNTLESGFIGEILNKENNPGRITTNILKSLFDVNLSLFKKQRTDFLARKAALVKKREKLIVKQNNLKIIQQETMIIPYQKLIGELDQNIKQYKLKEAYQKSAIKNQYNLIEEHRKSLINKQCNLAQAQLDKVSELQKILTELSSVKQKDPTLLDSFIEGYEAIHMKSTLEEAEFCIKNLLKKARLQSGYANRRNTQFEADTASIHIHLAEEMLDDLEKLTNFSEMQGLIVELKIIIKNLKDTIANIVLLPTTGLIDQVENDEDDSSINKQIALIGEQIKHLQQQIEQIDEKMEMNMAEIEKVIRKIKIKDEEIEKHNAGSRTENKEYVENSYFSNINISTHHDYMILISHLEKLKVVLNDNNIAILDELINLFKNGMEPDKDSLRSNDMFQSLIKQALDIINKHKAIKTLEGENSVQHIRENIGVIECIQKGILNADYQLMGAFEYLAIIKKHPPSSITAGEFLDALRTADLSNPPEIRELYGIMLSFKGKIVFDILTHPENYSFDGDGDGDGDGADAIVPAIIKTFTDVEITWKDVLKLKYLNDIDEEFTNNRTAWLASNHDVHFALWNSGVGYNELARLFFTVMNHVKTEKSPSLNLSESVLVRNEEGNEIQNSNKSVSAIDNMVSNEGLLNSDQLFADSILTIVNNYIKDGRSGIIGFFVPTAANTALAISLRESFNSCKKSACSQIELLFCLNFYRNRLIEVNSRRLLPRIESQLRCALGITNNENIEQKLTNLLKEQEPAIRMKLLIADINLIVNDFLNISKPNGRNANCEIAKYMKKMILHYNNKANLDESDYRQLIAGCQKFYHTCKSIFKDVGGNKLLERLHAVLKIHEIENEFRDDNKINQMKLKR